MTEYSGSDPISPGIIARGGRFRILEGPQKFHRFVVIEFASLEEAVACHDSPEYQERHRHFAKAAAARWNS